MRAGLVVEAPVRLADLEGIPAADALDRLAPERVNPRAGDDPRAQREDRDPPDDEPEDESSDDEVDGMPFAERNERKRAQCRAAERRDLMDKACTMLWTKDLDSVADHKVVKQNLVQLARKMKTFENDDDADRTLAEIFTAALKRTFDTRLKEAKDISISRVTKTGRSLTWKEAFGRGLLGQPGKSNSWDKERVKWLPDLDMLGFYEGVRPFSLHKIRLAWIPWCMYMLAMIIRLLFSLLAEKAVYLVSYALIASLNGPGVALYCRMPVFPSYEIPAGQMFSDEHYDQWKTSMLEYNAKKRLCAAELHLPSVFCAYIILVAIEIFALTLRRIKLSERISDGALRIGFHSIDAYIACGLLVSHETGLSDCFVNSDFVWLCEMAILTVHLIWNVLCIFWWKCPERCFCLTEAVQVLCSKVYKDVCLEDHDMKRVKTQDKFKVTCADVACKPKDSVFVFWGLKGIVPTVFSNCSHNEEISMQGRVGKLLPAHESPAIFKRITNNWVRLIRSVSSLIDLIPKSEEPMDFYEWAATFPPARRDELIATRTHTHDMPDLHAKSFIKREIALKLEEEMVFKDPRFIQGCPIELSAAVGPTLRTWTKLVRDEIGPEGFTPAEVRSGKHILYTCGRSNEEIGRCFRRAITVIEELSDPDDPIVFLEDDQSRFDLHLTAGPFKFLKTVYKKKLRPKVEELLRRGISRGTSSLGTRYSIPYTMQSGWPDTSVGDTLVNAAMKYYIHGKGRSWVSIICGDDSVTITTQSEIDRLGGIAGIVQSYADLGMEVEGKVSYDPLDVEFCSGRFYPCGDTYVLFPKPGRILAKIACDMKKRSRENQKAWLRGICATLRYYGRIDPLLGCLGVALSRHIGNGRLFYDHGWEYKHWFDGSVQNDRHDVNLYYDHHYGSSASQIDAACILLLQQKVGTVCDDAFLRHIAAIDIC